MAFQEYRDEMIGKKVIVRSRASGVHFGTLLAWEGNDVCLKDTRRLWRWSTGGAGISLSEIAVCGIDQTESRITMTLNKLFVLGVCEVIPAEGLAIATIEGANTYTPN